MWPCSIHAADAWIAAHTAGAGRSFRARWRSSIGSRGKSGVLLADVLLTAVGAVYIGGFRRTPDQLLELRVAILALIFVDRHNLFDHRNTYFIKNRANFASWGQLVVGQERKRQHFSIAALRITGQ